VAQVATGESQLISAADTGPDSATTPRFRVAEERLSLHGLVERLAVLVTSGIKPVLTIGAVDPEGVDTALRELVKTYGLRWAVIDGSGSIDRHRGALCLAHEWALILRGAEVQRAISGGDQSARAAMGLLMGFPECCVDAHVHGPFAGMPLPNWAALARRAERDAPVPVALQPLLVPSLTFVPCSMHCARAHALYEQWFAALGIDPRRYGGDDVVQILSLSGPPDDAFAVLRHVQEHDGALGYDPAQVQCRDTPLRAKLTAGTRVTPEPTDMRILSGARLVATLGPGHACWSTAHCWHAERWRQHALLEAERFVNRAATVAPRG
jgi:hypothetical protein